MKYILITIAAAAAIYFLVKLFTENETKQTPNQIMTKFTGPQDYVTKLKPAAKSIEAKTKIPYLFILAQTALETGYGKSSLVYEAFNFGGVKAKQGQPFITKYTTEYVTDVSKYPNRDKAKDVKQPDGKTKIFVPQNFAKYPDLVTGLTEYSKILLLPRYKEAFKYSDPKLFAAEIKKGGYATDPNYVSKINTIIDSIKNNYI